MLPMISPWQFPGADAAEAALRRGAHSSVTRSLHEFTKFFGSAFEKGFRNGFEEFLSKKYLNNLNFCVSTCAGYWGILNAQLANAHEGRYDGEALGRALGGMSAFLSIALPEVPFADKDPQVNDFSRSFAPLVGYIRSARINFRFVLEILRAACEIGQERNKNLDVFYLRALYQLRVGIESMGAAA